MAKDFFDEYQPSGPASGSFIKSDEKKVIMENGQALTVTAVSEEDSTDFGERYVLHVTLDDEQRRMSFTKGSVESRDEMLAALAKWFEANEGKTVDVKLEKVGRSIIIRSAK